MKKLILIVLVLIFYNVNGQELRQNINFTIVSSSKIDGNKIDSLFTFIPNIISITDKKITLSIYTIDFEKNPELVINEKLPKVRLLSYYKIAENLAITTPEWEFDNINAVGFRLTYDIR